MGVIIDTRQQKGKHEAKHRRFEELGVATVRCALPFGDYCMTPKVSVDTKASIYELAMNIDQDHARFRNEQVLAKDNGTKLVILTENDDGVTDLESLSQWRESRDHLAMRRSKGKNPKTRRIEGERLAKACLTMAERYGTVFDFCRPEEAGDRVLQLLGGLYGD